MVPHGRDRPVAASSGGLRQPIAEGRFGAGIPAGPATMRKPAPADGRSAAGTPVDRRWKTLTSAANKAFDDGDMARAATLYTEAMDEAARRFRTDRATATMANAPPMLVVACANVADHLARAGDHALAAGTMRWTLDHLRAALLDPCEAPAFRQACLRHIEPALLEYARQAGAAKIGAAEFARVTAAARDAVHAFLSEKRTLH